MAKSNLRAERARLGMTQEELAEKMGVARGTIVTWETDIGSISGRKLAELAEILGVTCDYLVGRGTEK